MMEGHWLHEWWDETSMYDHEGVWFGGIECYMRKYRVWIPDSIRPDDKDAVDDYVQQYFDTVREAGHEADRG